MPLGLLPQDIVTSFSQSVSGDFAVGAVDGYTIINNEIELQYNKMLTYLPSEVLNQMERINGEVTNVSLSGEFTPSFYAVPETMHGYILPKDYQVCLGAALGCGTETEAVIVDEGDNLYSLDEEFDSKTQKLVIYYDVDSTNLLIPSLKTFLRSLVCHSLGSRLFPVGNSDVWSIVTYYGEDCKQWMELFASGKYLPAEFSRIKLLNKKSGITSIRVARS